MWYYVLSYRFWMSFVIQSWAIYQFCPFAVLAHCRGWRWWRLSSEKGSIQRLDWHSVCWMMWGAVGSLSAVGKADHVGHSFSFAVRASQSWEDVNLKDLSLTIQEGHPPMIVQGHACSIIDHQWNLSCPAFVQNRASIRTLNSYGRFMESSRPKIRTMR